MQNFRCIIHLFFFITILRFFKNECNYEQKKWKICQIFWCQNWIRKSDDENHVRKSELSWKILIRFYDQNLMFFEKIIKYVLVRNSDKNSDQKFLRWEFCLIEVFLFFAFFFFAYMPLRFKKKKNETFAKVKNYVWAYGLFFLFSIVNFLCDFFRLKLWQARKNGLTLQFWVSKLKMNERRPTEQLLYIWWCKRDKDLVLCEL